MAIVLDYGLGKTPIAFFLWRDRFLSLVVFGRFANVSMIDTRIALG